MNQRRIGQVWAVVAAVLFSTGGAAIKTEAFTALQVSAARSGSAALVLWIVVGHRLRVTAGTVAIGAVYAATLTLFVAATKFTTAASAIFIQSTAPLYLLLIGPLVLREPLRRVDLAHAAVMMTGLVVCLVGQTAATGLSPDPSRGNLLALASSVGWACVIAGLRGSSRGGRSLQGLSPVIVGNALAAVAAWPFLGAVPPGVPASAWGTLVYLGIIQVALAYVCLTRALDRLSAFDVSLLLLLEPILNPLWTWFVRAERPGVPTLVGGAIIVLTSAARVVGAAALDSEGRSAATPLSSRAGSGTLDGLG